MKFQQGDNEFRILGSPIVGWEGWVETEEGRKPKRFRMNEEPVDKSQFQENRVKHFWSLPVWNYRNKAVEILHITQVSIQTAIKQLDESKKWGDPMKYEINVIRQGEGMETEYTVQPQPKEELSEEVKQAWKEADINLEALFTGDNPFEGGDSTNSTVEISEMDENGVAPQDSPF